MWPHTPAYREGRVASGAAGGSRAHVYICVLILLYMWPQGLQVDLELILLYICVLILLYMWPHTPIYVSSYSCVCPHTAIYVASGAAGGSRAHAYICVLILRYICVLILLRVSSYCCICVLILLYLCPHTAVYVSSYCCVCVSSYCFIGGSREGWDLA
jgi:hypothetical protein